MNELRDLSKCLTMNEGNRPLEESTLVPEIIQRLKVGVSGCSVLPLAHQPAPIGGLAVSFWTRPRMRSSTSTDN